MTSPRLVLHEDPVSGNCYKIRLVAAILGLPLERRGYDILKGETRTPAFLARVNPDGRIPVLQVGDRFLPESNAACLYLADGSDLVPRGRFERADMMRWLFWEQYSHEPNIATLRFWRAFVGEDRLSDAQRAMIPGKEAAGRAALDLMERQLRRSACLAGDRVTLADLVLYPYTHVAGGGGFDLGLYPAIDDWMERIGRLPGFVPMADAV
ncbi:MULTISPECIES: glutathione S-transferase family protein [unclassified Sphingomonas]|jgi:glutathione S-transferase|uniref:glutathione S-transferase family protein n=1 Tax=unclassified Sphingomonas TaxID=196159 RepID=UPI0008321AF4|nr:MULTISPECIES: glutathione S-transferase family protein [unclassified Sphingomonas]